MSFTSPMSRRIVSILSFSAAMSPAKTTWLVSLDAVSKLSPSRSYAVVDSVPLSVNESV